MFDSKSPISEFLVHTGRKAVYGLGLCCQGCLVGPDDDRPIDKVADRVRASDSKRVVTLLGKGCTRLLVHVALFVSSRSACLQRILCNMRGSVVGSFAITEFHDLGSSSASKR